jgi:hypothetical protein
MTDYAANLSIRVGADTTDARQKLKDLERLGDAFGRRITSSFSDAIFSGKTLTQTMRSLALELSKLTLKSALQPLTSGIGGMLAGIGQSLFPFAKGGCVIAHTSPFRCGRCCLRSGDVSARRWMDWVGGRGGSGSDLASNAGQ